MRMFHVLLAGLSLCAPALGDQSIDAADGELPWRREIPIGDQLVLQLSPTTDLYPRYIADPRAPRFNLLLVPSVDSEVDDTGSSRLGITLGGRYGFARLHHRDDPETGVQLDAEGAFMGAFDMEHSLDNIGWDGFYGLMLSARSGKLAFRLALQHDSSHLGDEYVERTQRLRLNYTREEVVIGAACSPFGGLQAYAEVGWAYHRGGNGMKPWRLQMGIQYESEPFLWGDRVGWYAAVDNVLWDERDWASMTTFQVGLVGTFPAIGRKYRLGIQVGQGRALVGEMFEEDEKYAGFGFWLDL